MLNSGIGFTDIFEQECLLHADKLNAQSRYKEWLHNMKVRSISCMDESFQGYFWFQNFETFYSYVMYRENCYFRIWKPRFQDS